METEVRCTLDALPRDATLEDVQYRLYACQAIGAGLRDIAAGRTIGRRIIRPVRASDNLVSVVPHGSSK